MSRPCAVRFRRLRRGLHVNADIEATQMFCHQRRSAYP